MPEKIVTSRIINKHDVERNWNSSSFIPQKGELIVYDVDSNHTYERFKIGDGVNAVPNLPWSSSQIQSMVALEENQDLNGCTPSYTGESVTYYTNSNTLASTLSNCPTQVSFRLTSTCLAVTGRYVQVLQDIDDNLYVRSCDADVWTDWQLQTNSTGSYPDLTAGKSTSDDEGNNIFDTYMGRWALNQLKDGTSSTDFNDYVESGFYELLGLATTPMSNAPVSSSNTSNSSGNWYLQVLRRDSSYITQVAYSVRTDTAIAIRSYSAGTWGNWRLINEWGGNLMMAPTKSTW